MLPAKGTSSFFKARECQKVIIIVKKINYGFIGFDDISSNCLEEEY